MLRLAKHNPNFRMSPIGPKRTRRAATVVAAIGGKADKPLIGPRGSF